MHHLSALGERVAAADLLRPGQPRFLPRLHRRVREAVRNLCSEVPDLHWLPDAGVVPLTDETCLVGPTAGAMDGSGITTVPT